MAHMVWIMGVLRGAKLHLEVRELVCNYFQRRLRGMNCSQFCYLIAAEVVRYPDHRSIEWRESGQRSFSSNPTAICSYSLVENHGFVIVKVTEAVRVISPELFSAPDCNHVIFSMMKGRTNAHQAFVAGVPAQAWRCHCWDKQRSWI